MADLCYRGQTAEFKRRRGDSISTDSAGIKRGLLVFEGDKNNLDNFFTSWPDGAQHPDDSDLKKIGHQIYFRGPVAQVTMQFAGDVQNGGGVKLSSVYRTKTAILRAAGSDVPETNFRVSYYAPSVTLQWTNSTEIATPQKQDESGLSAGDDVDIWFAEGEPVDTPPVLADPNDVFVINTDYTTRPFCEQFQIEPLGDALYLITETWSIAVDSAYNP